MANKSNINRNQFMLEGPLAKKGYDWWWHSFTARHPQTGVQKSFFIEFFTCNPAMREKEPIFGEDGRNPRPSYMMVKCGTWGEDHAQLHRFFSWDTVQMHKKAPFSLQAGDCSLSETFTKGCVYVSKEQSENHPEWMSDSGSMEWELSIHKKTAFHVGYGAASLFRKINAFEMFWHAEGMKTEYDGWIIYNGTRYVVEPDTSFGYADKNWGGDFTSPWVWLSSCNLTSLKTGKQLSDSVFDIGGGCPKVFGIPLKRKLLSDFYYEGKNYEFNFSKFWTGTRTKFSCAESDTKILWHVEQETFRAKMISDITCEKKEMILMKYESPDGFQRHKKLWNGGNGVGTVRLYQKKYGKYICIDEIHAENVGCEYGEYGK